MSSTSYTGDFDYFVGGGVASFDCNDDGLTGPVLRRRHVAPRRSSSTSRRRGGALSFAPLAEPVTDLTQVTGAYPIDFDGDGITDLAVLRNGENVLLRGLGDCHFERANEQWGFDGGDDWSTAFSAKWDRERPGRRLRSATT